MTSQEQSTEGRDDDVDVLWYLTAPDGPYPWVPEGRWNNDTDIDHFKRVAEEIDRSDFHGALVATTGASDVFTFGASLISATKRMRFLLALYPGLVSPRQMAHMALTFDALSQGRMLINVINGADDLFPAHGTYLKADERYELSNEYWSMFKALYGGDRRAQQGRFYNLASTETEFDAYTEWLSPVQAPHPPLWGAGGSPAGLKNAGSLLDVYLTFVDEPDYLAVKLERARAAAATAGRTFQDFGVWVSVIVRETEQEAWSVAQDLLAKTGAERIARSIDEQLRTQLNSPGGLAEAASENPKIQRVIEALRRGELPDARDLEFHPNMWVGPSDWTPPALLEIFDPRRSLGKYLVGSADQLAAAIRKLRTLGIGKFILGGWPLIDEARHVSQLLLPRLSLRKDDGGVRAAKVLREQHTPVDELHL